MARKKTLVPNDVRDYLSLLSIIGFVAIFLQFTLNYGFLSENLSSVFLLVAGAILLMVSKVVSVGKWVRDGIQGNEFTRLFGIVFGVAAVVVGVMLFFTEIPVGLTGFVGILALPPAIFIVFDYISKNTRRN